MDGRELCRCLGRRLCCVLQCQSSSPNHPNLKNGILLYLSYTQLGSQFVCRCWMNNNGQIYLCPLRMANDREERPSMLDFNMAHSFFPQEIGCCQRCMVAACSSLIQVNMHARPRVHVYGVVRNNNFQPTVIQCVWPPKLPLMSLQNCYLPIGCKMQLYIKWTYFSYPQIEIVVSSYD